jgi:hypothetical protein
MMKCFFVSVAEFSLKQKNTQKSMADKHAEHAEWLALRLVMAS